MSGTVTFGTGFAPKAKENEWVETVNQLIEATKTDPTAFFTVTVEASKEASTALAIQQAANAAGVTARKREVDTSKAVYTPRVDSDGKPVMTKQGKTQKVDASGTVDMTFTIANDVVDGKVVFKKHEARNTSGNGKSK
jgi:hypothetical protein